MDEQNVKCAECGYEYPAEILAPLATSEGAVGSVCGICALELTNAVHGIKREKFDAPIAEQMRLAAIEHRER